MDIIPGDPHVQSKNGRILQSVVEENDLVVVNGTEISTGLITRYRKTVNSEEKSIIDFFIVCRRLFLHVVKLEIDEKREHCLTKYSTKSGKQSQKESDHNTLILEIDIEVQNPVKRNSKETFFNYKSEHNFQLFVKTHQIINHLKNALMMKQKT